MALTKVQNDGVETLITNNSDIRVVTGSGTINTLNGEANLTFDGSVLTNSGSTVVGNDIKSGTDDPYIYSYKGGSDGQVRSGIKFDGTNERMELYTGTNERMRVDSTGAQVTGFIKTTAPVAWYGRQGTTENSIATDTWTTVTNLTIHPVTTTGWDGSTGIFTVPTGQGGTYFLTGGVGIDDVQSRDFVYIGFSKNDATPSPYQWGKQSYDSSNALVNVNMTILMALADGDTVRMKTKHNEGTTENTEYAVTFFGGYRIT